VAVPAFSEDAGLPGRLPPQDLEAEEAVLGAMLISEVALGECLEHLQPEDFYRTGHAEIFRAIRELAQGAQKIDQLTVSDQLHMRGTLEQVGGKAMVFGLAESPPVVANARRYAEIVRTNATLRGLIRAGGQIAQLGYDRPGEVEDLVDQAQQVVYDLARHGDREDFAAIRELLADAFVRISELSAGEGAGGVTGIATGFRDLDRITAGLQRSNLIILAARPSMGKTSLALNVAEHVAVQLRQPVALFSLEMSKLELAQRLMCSVAGIDQGRLRTGQLANDDWPKLSGAVDVLSDAPFYIDDSAGVSVLEIRSKARRLEQQTGRKLGLVVVDYLQLMTQPGGSENRVQEISQISRALKVLGRDLDVPVLALSQLSRAVEQRQDKRPILSDLRESGSIEQDADVVMFIYRDSYYRRGEDGDGLAPDDPDHDKSEVILAKHRNGPTGTVDLRFQARFTRFINDYTGGR
jgi:replicative DNA helicase